MVFALMFSACTQEIIIEQSEGAPSDNIPETLTIGFEENDTRIELNEANKTVWTANDNISVFYQSDANQKWRFIGKTGDRIGTFKRVSSGTETTKTERVVIVYPYSEGHQLNTETLNVRTVLPTTQTYKKDSYGQDGNIMIHSGEYNQFTLRTINGWLKLQLTGSGDKVKSIKFRGNNDEQVAGEVYINSVDGNIALAADQGTAENDSEVGGSLIFDDTIATEITLNCGDGVELGSEITTFYIALPPQTFSKGFTIEIEGANGYVMTKSTNKSVTISRNTIQPMEKLRFATPKVELTAYWNYAEDAKVDAAILTNDHSEPHTYNRHIQVPLEELYIEGLPADADIVEMFNSQPYDIVVNNKVVPEVEIHLTADNDYLTIHVFDLKWDMTYDVEVLYTLSNAQATFNFTLNTFDRQRTPIYIDLGEYYSIYSTDLILTTHIGNPLIALTNVVYSNPENFNGISESEFLKDVFENRPYINHTNTVNGEEALRTKLLIDTLYQEIYTTYDFRDSVSVDNGAVVENLEYCWSATLWYGQQVTFVSKLHFVAPEITFIHNHDKVLESMSGYRMNVEAEYFSVSDYQTELMSFDTKVIDLNEAFYLKDHDTTLDIADEDSGNIKRGYSIANNGNKFLTTFTLCDAKDVYNPESRRGILLYDNYLYYYGKDDYVNVDASLYLLNSNGAKMRISTNFDSPDKYGYDYTNFIVNGHNPIRSVTGSLYQCNVRGAGQYAVDFTELFSITDSRGYEIVNRGRYNGNDFFVTGNGTNGFYDYYNAAEVYSYFARSPEGVIEDSDVLIPMTVSFNAISNGSIPQGYLNIDTTSGYLSLYNESNSGLTNPVSVKITMHLKSGWGEYSTNAMVTFW